MQHSMDMGAFDERQSSAGGGVDFGNIPKMVISNGITGRLVGNFASVHEHWVDTPQGPRPFFCEGPESDCPICAAASELAMSDREEDQKLAKKIKAKERFYFNALDRSPAGRAWHEQNKKTKVLTQSEKALSVGVMVFKAIGAVVKMRQQQGADHDPNTFDMMFTKTGSGMNTEYSVQFTGGVDPLTEEEAAYEMWPLDQLSKVSPRADRQKIADMIMGRESSGQETQQEAADDFNPQNYGAPNPAAAPPAAAPPPAAPPGQTPPPAEKKKLQLKTRDEYQNTKPPQNPNDIDASTQMVVPCSNCGADMLIDMEDDRDIKCHNCGTTYDHPAKD